LQQEVQSWDIGDGAIEEMSWFDPIKTCHCETLRVGKSD
jgi:hypothetical protein